MAVRLDDQQAAVLRGFRSVDPEGEYQHNYWSPVLVAAVKTEGATSGWERELPSLVRRGLLGAEGRSRYRQYWITEEGLAVLLNSA